MVWCILYKANTHREQCSITFSFLFSLQIWFWRENKSNFFLFIALCHSYGSDCTAYIFMSFGNGLSFQKYANNENMIEQVRYLNDLWTWAVRIQNGRIIFFLSWVNIFGLRVCFVEKYSFCSLHIKCAVFRKSLFF